MEDENIIPEVVNYSLEDKFTMENIENRRIYITQEITGELASEVVYHILRYNRCDKGIEVKKRTPIIVYIDTGGGDCTAAFSIIDAIMMSKTPIYTVNIGKCYSAGVYIFLSGEKRYATPNSTFLQHDGTFGVNDSYSKTIDAVEFDRVQYSSHIKKFVLNRTNISAEQYDANFRKEWYFYPTEGFEIGYVTNIIGVNCDIDDIL